MFRYFHYSFPLEPTNTVSLCTSRSDGLKNAPARCCGISIYLFVNGERDCIGEKKEARPYTYIYLRIRRESGQREREKCRATLLILASSLRKTIKKRTKLDYDAAETHFVIISAELMEGVGVLRAT